MQKKRYEKPFTKYAADTDVVLECLHEVYGLEGKQVLSGKNIHSTMIYPFTVSYTHLTLPTIA